jgi:hypothetical protein
MHVVISQTPLIHTADREYALTPSLGSERALGLAADGCDDGVVAMASADSFISDNSCFGSENTISTLNIFF